MISHHESRDDPEREPALQDLAARHAGLDRRLSELRDLLQRLPQPQEGPSTLERTVVLLRQAVEDLAADSLDLHRQIGELRRRVGESSTPALSWDRRLLLTGRTMAQGSLSLARAIRARLRQVAWGASGWEPIRRREGRLRPSFPQPALAVVLREGSRVSSAGARESGLDGQTLAAAGAIEWIRTGAGSKGSVAPSVPAESLSSPFVFSAGRGADRMPAVALELAVLELLLEDLLFVKLRLRGSSTPAVDEGWVVRRDVWCPRRGIDWQGLVHVANRERRWVLGKVLPLVGGEADQRSAESRVRRTARRGGEERDDGIGHTDPGGGPPGRWREDGYFVRRGVSKTSLPTVAPSYRLEPPALPTGGRPSTLLALPFVGDFDLDELLAQVLARLADRSRFGVVTLEPQPVGTGRRLGLLRRITPWVVPLGEQEPPELHRVRLGYVARRLGARSLVWVDSMGVPWEAGAIEVQDLLEDLAAEDPDLRLACLATSREAAATYRRWETFREVAVLGEDVSVGVDLGVYDPTRFSVEERQRRRRELGADQETVLVLMAADLSPEQRPEDFLALAQRLQSDRRFVFVLAGDGPLASSVDDLARFLGLRELRRLSSTSDRAELLAAADIVVSPAEHDPAPLSVLGGLALERPVVISAASSLASRVREAGCGRIVDEVGDVGGLAAAVEGLAGAGERADLGGRGRALVENRYDLATSAETFARLAGLEASAAPSRSAIGGRGTGGSR